MKFRRDRGTTLVEVLVVIVILTVGILAVIQIFPKGFQVLSQTRATSQAAALVRSEAERLKNRGDRVPEAILPLNVSGSLLVVDSTISPDDLGPIGDRIAQDGTLSLNGNTIGPVSLWSGVNKFRRIVGETAVNTGTGFSTTNTKLFDSASAGAGLTTVSEHSPA